MIKLIIAAQNFYGEISSTQSSNMPHCATFNQTDSSTHYVQMAQCYILLILLFKFFFLYNDN